MVSVVKNEELRAVLRAAFHRAQHPGVVAAFLFGSHARGAAHRDSDIDVSVLLDRRRFPDRRVRFAARLQLTGWLIAATHCNQVDVVVLNDAPPLLSRHIVTTGERLFCADEAVMHSFYRDALLRAADIAPFLRRMARIKLAALAQ
jgi:predicted nucleotidyltransferase